MQEDYTAEQLVFLDETAKDERTPTRRYGYSEEGTRAVVWAPFVRGQRYTVTAAVASTGTVAVDVIAQSSTAAYLLDFIQTYLVCEVTARFRGDLHS